MKQAATVILAMAASAVLFLLAMPPMSQGYLAWVMFVPLFLAVRGIGAAFGFLCGLGTCLLAAVLCSANLFYPAVVADADNGWVYTGLSILGLLVGIVSGIVAEQKSIGYLAAIAIAALAAILEWASGVLLTANIGITQYKHGMMLEVASVTGVWGVSFLIWLVNVKVAAVMSKPALGAWAFLVMLFAFSGRQLPQSLESQHMRVAAVQAADPLRDEIAELNKQAAAKGATIAVWPELSGSLFVSGGDTAPLKLLSQEQGQVRFVTSFEDAAMPPHNVAALFYNGKESMHYEKRRLFGGERAIRQSGDKPASHENIGINICFDSCYPNVIRETALLPGVAVIALPNHDPASPNGFVQACHAAFTPFRAAENGVAMIRADSSGYSMIVDSVGRVVAKAGLGTREVIVGEVSSRARDTIYKRFGDWFLWLCAAIVLLRFAFFVKGRRKLAKPVLQ